MNFQKRVLQGSLFVATRVMVAEALARWSFYHQQISAVVEVVEIAIQRFSVVTKPKLLHLSEKGFLTSKSSYLIYFVTHIVLVATMWGECALMKQDDTSYHNWKLYFLLDFRASTCKTTQSRDLVGASCLCPFSRH